MPILKVKRATTSFVMLACAGMTVVLLLAGGAFAADATVQRVEAYLNGITTLQARFAQTNMDGSVESGDFYLKRPGRLRFQYDAKKGDYIVADGLLIHYWDNQSKDYSNAPIGSTMADFLLRKKITLGGDLRVTQVLRSSANKLVLTLVQADNPEAGNLKLLLQEQPLQLQKWRITDAQGQITEVSLRDIQTGMKLDPRLFIFKAPKGYENAIGGER